MTHETVKPVKKNSTETRKAITSFTESYRFLSNFYLCPVQDDRGQEYPSVEHAYQASKTLDPVERSWFTTGSAAEAKKKGRRITLRPDWDVVKLSVMENLLRQKFAEPSLAAALRATEPSELIEGNWWGDTYWGVCRGQGQNHLGRLLMQIRQEGL